MNSESKISPFTVRSLILRLACGSVSATVKLILMDATFPPTIYLAPLFIFFEAVQLVMAERYLGAQQAESGINPREMPMSEFLAFTWSVGIIFTWLWMLASLLFDVGRIQVVAMLLASMIGYSLRRNCSRKWVLPIMTAEATVRIGMLMSLITVAWRSI